MTLMKVTRITSLLALLAGPVLAQNNPPPSPIPVRQVTLFTSGVAYTERTGQVDGDATVPLLFRTAQINDILKSLVLLDTNGKVQPATYTARDPIGRTLQSFAVDVTENLSLEQLLARLRGAQVTVDTPGKGAITGRIVGVEMRDLTPDERPEKRPVLVPFLTILGDNGLTTVRLDGEKTIKLLDPRLNREFHEALELLATGADDQRRQVTLHFAGEGKRDVRVGYVTEAPLWKMSYRLLVGGAQGQGAGAGAGKSYMQGWALVENTSDDDWKDIRLSLVSGRPVSFIQDLYQPLYIPRPIVGPDVVASAYPQTHGGDLDESRRKVAQVPVLGDLPLLGSLARSGRDRGPAGEKGDKGDPGPPGMTPEQPMMRGGFGRGGGGRGFTAEEMKQSLQAQAAGQSAGELFQYNITTPVTLPRQQAAMIPVIAQDIETEKVSIFNADSGGKYPLNAVRVKNNTGLHLKGGPVTLFDEGVYAGDAKMEDIPPGDNRLVSYAVDLTVEGERQGPSGSSIETSFILRGGVLTIGRKEKLQTSYTLKSKAQKAKTVLIEHPFQSDFTLVAPAKATERTANLYRFAVDVPAGESKKLLVVTERQIADTIGVFDTNLETIVVHATRKEVPQKIREALQEVIQRRRKVQEIQAQAASREQEIGAIMQDQDRIRKNMTALDKASALYKRYVTELDKQETRIQDLRQEAARLRREASAAEAELRKFVNELSISG